MRPDEPTISSPRNERLRRVRALATRRGRRKHGRFLLEGPRAIHDLLLTSPDAVEELLLRAGHPLEPATQALADARGVSQVTVAAAAFDEVAPSDTPQPVVAVAKLRWRTLGEVVGPAGDAPRAVAACAGVQDPGNLGTILRTARFFGLAGVVLLPGTHDPFSPKVVRSTAGAVAVHPPAQAADLSALVDQARAAGLEAVALAAHGGEPLTPDALPPRTLLVLGAEGPGLPDAARALRQVTIAPPDPGAESLNVAVAFAVVAHTWAARWAARGS